MLPRVPHASVCCLFPSVSGCSMCIHPQMSRSASTLTLSDSAKSGAAVQRSNSLDHPPVRPRVPIALRVPSSPTPIPPQSPSPKPGPERHQSLHPNYCLRGQESKSAPGAPKSPQSGQPTSVSTGLPPVQISKLSQPKSSQQLSSVGSQSRFLPSRNLQVDPHSRTKSSPKRETLL